MMKILLILFFACFLVSGKTRWKSYRYGETGAPPKIFVKGFDSKDNMWLGYSGNSIISFDGEYYTRHRVDNELDGLDSISSIFTIENDSIFWLEGKNNEHDLVEFNLNSGEKISHNKTTITTGYDLILAPAFSPNGEVWFRTKDSGIVVLKDDKWLKYDTTNSTIPLNYHTLICFDSTGNTYVSSGTISGSKGGVSKYDGDNWEHFDFNNSPIPKALVVDITIDKNNALWIASDSGLNRLFNNEWSTWTTNDIGFSESPNYKSFYNLRVSPDNIVWVNSNKKHLYYKDDKWNILEEKFTQAPYDSQGVLPVSFDSTGNVWIVTSSKGIIKFDYETVEVYDSLNSVIPNYYPSNVYTSPSGTVWSGMAKFDPIEKTWLTPLTFENTGLANDNVSSAYILPDNRPLFITDKGVSIRDSLQRWTVFEDDIIDSIDLSSLKFFANIMDTTFAFGTSNSSSYIGARFSNNQWTPIKSNIPEDVTINDLAFSLDKRIWLATDKGVWTFKDNNWTKFSSTNLPTETTLSITTKENQPTIGNQSGIFTYNGSKWIKYDDPQNLVSSYYITDVTYDSLGNLWGATLRDGILYFDQTNWTNYTTSNSLLPTNTINEIKIDRVNKIWFVCNESGIASFDRTNWQRFDTSNSDINSNLISTIVFDKGNTKWIANKSDGVNNYSNDDTTSMIPFSSTDKSKGILVQKSKLIFNISSKEAQIRIYNIQGKVIQKQTWTRDSGEFHIPRNLVKGIYFINVKTSESQNIFRVRI